MSTQSNGSVQTFRNLHVIAWLSFLSGVTHGLLIGFEDADELDALLPLLGYDPTDAFSEYPLSPENQALIDSAGDGARLWASPAKRAHRDIVDGLFFFGGRMPADSAVAWYGYLRGRLEAGSINQSEYADLIRMLPLVENNPVDLIVESAKAAKHGAQA